MTRRSMASVLLLILGASLGSETARAADLTEREFLWNVLQTQASARRIRLTLDAGPVEAKNFFVRGDSLFMATIVSQSMDARVEPYRNSRNGQISIPVRDIRHCEVLVAGKFPRKPASPGVNAVTGTAFALGLLGGSIAIAEDGSSWYQSYTGLLAAAGVTVALFIIPAYFRSSHWVTIDVPVTAASSVP